tara:strand:+ start:432 stop:1634 length:1203 start_codon:yes stop_codon:yes gene_type:complete
LIFQLLDDKSDCPGYYLDGAIHTNQPLPDSLSGTWKYSSKLKSCKGVKYAHLYAGGKSLDEVCPSHIEQQWQSSSQKLKAFYRSFVESKVSLEENCFFDLVPEHFLVQYFDLRNKITSHVLENYECPENYRFLRDLAVLVDDIRNRPMNIDTSSMKDQLHKMPARNFLNKVNKARPICDYNMFGTKTGRLTTKKGTFPILTMDREYRSIVRPVNDCFLELDFNAAQLRTMLSLLGEDQPDLDLHEWNRLRFFDGTITREEAKRKAFAWLFGSSRERIQSQEMQKMYDKERLKHEYWDGTHVTTPFGRKIAADEHHALNYLLQSTCVDNTLRQMVSVNKLLKKTKSFVSFTMHDSVIIDMDFEERTLIPIIVSVFSGTKLGEFVTNLKAGKDYGNMKDLMT